MGRREVGYDARWGKVDWRQGALALVAHGRESVDLRIMEGMLS